MQEAKSYNRLTPIRFANYLISCHFLSAKNRITILFTILFACDLYHLHVICTSNFITQVMVIIWYSFSNTAARTKLNFQTAVLKARGQARGENIKYNQPESVLGEVLVKAGQDLGEDSPFGKNYFKDMLFIVYDFYASF